MFLKVYFYFLWLNIKILMKIINLIKIEYRMRDNVLFIIFYFDCFYMFKGKVNLIC